MKLREKMQQLAQRKREEYAKRSNKYDYLMKVCYAVGIISLFSMPLVGATMIGLGTCLMAANENHIDKINSKVEAIKTEEQNLSRSSYTGIDSSPRANQIRNSKLQALQERKERQESAVTSSKLFNGLLNIGAVVSACAAIATPGVLSFVTPAIALVKLVQNKNLYKNVKALDQTEAQINSLNNEKQFASEYPLRKQQVKQNVVQNNAQPKQRVTVKTSRIPQQQNVRPMQTRMANDYYNNMFFTGNKDQEKAKVYQKVRV